MNLSKFNYSDRARKGEQYSHDIVHECKECMGACANLDSVLCTREEIKFDRFHMEGSTNQDLIKYTWVWRKHLFQCGSIEIPY